MTFRYMRIKHSADDDDDNKVNECVSEDKKRSFFWFKDIRVIMLNCYYTHNCCAARSLSFSSDVADVLCGV